MQLVIAKASEPVTCCVGLASLFSVIIGVNVPLEAVANAYAVSC